MTTIDFKFCVRIALGLLLPFDLPPGPLLGLPFDLGSGGCGRRLLGLRGLCFRRLGLGRRGCLGRCRLGASRLAQQRLGLPSLHLGQEVINLAVDLLRERLTVGLGRRRIGLGRRDNRRVGIDRWCWGVRLVRHRNRPVPRIAARLRACGTAWLFSYR